MSESGETNPFKRMMRKSPSPNPTNQPPSTQAGNSRPVSPSPGTPAVSSAQANLRPSFETKAPRSPLGSPPLSRKSSVTQARTPLAAPRQNPQSPGQTLRDDNGMDATVRSHGGESVGAGSNANSVSQKHSSVGENQQQTTTSHPTEDNHSIVDDIQPEEPAVPYSAEARVVELEALLATRDKELHTSREQVNSLQRLQASSSSDTKIKILNEERAKLASKVKEIETKLSKEVDKWKREAKKHEAEVNTLKAKEKEKKSRDTVEARKSVSRAESEALAASHAIVADVNAKLQAATRASAEKDAEMVSLQRKLRRAHEAIEHGASVGYNNEVKLHQARSALHAIMSEVSQAASPVRDSRIQPGGAGGEGGGSPLQIQQQQMQQMQQQVSQTSGGGGGAAASPPRYVFDYSMRAGSGSPRH